MKRHVAIVVAMGVLHCAASKVEPRPAEPSSADAATEDASVGEIIWSWTGAYAFDRFRIVVEDCPGACSVTVDADGTKLAGVGRATSNRYQLEVRFTGDAGGFAQNDVLFTLEAAPGDQMVLQLGALESSDGRSTLVAKHPPLTAPRRDVR